MTPRPSIAPIEKAGQGRMQLTERVLRLIDSEDYLDDEHLVRLKDYRYSSVDLSPTTKYVLRHCVSCLHCGTRSRALMQAFGRVELCRGAHASMARVCCAFFELAASDQNIVQTEHDHADRAAMRPLQRALRRRGHP